MQKQPFIGLFLVIMKNKGWQRILGIIIPYIFIVGIFQVIGLIILDIDYRDSSIIHDLRIEKKVVLYLFMLMGTFLTIYIFTKYVDKDSFVNLGFSLKNKLKDILYGLFFGFIMLFLGFIILLVINQISFVEFNFSFKKIILYCILFLLVAFTEEIIFRGYFLKKLMLSFNKYTALIITSFLFAMFHGANPNMSFLSFLDLFLGGLLLGISYIHTKNLWFPIALHFSWNLFQSLLGFNVSGQDMYSIVEFKIKDNNLINGGEFGFEGSILSIIFQIFFIILLYYYFKKLKKSFS
jgi:membrane protease YdiL (CAAX protease family)